MNWRAQLVLLRQKASKQLDDYPALQAVPYWLAAFLCGFVAVGYTSLFHILSEASHSLIQKYSYWTLLYLPIFFILSWWIVRRFAILAVGSGIPQVMAALELGPDNYEKKLTYLIGVRTVCVKILSSLLSAFSGAAIGPEGPAIQICAGLFHTIGKKFQRIWPQIGHESLILAGGAAGVAAAFNTPLGGIVFAIEELSHRHFHKVKTALISAVIIAGLVAQWIKGPYLLFGYPPLRSPQNIFFLWAIGMGIVTGVLGAFFSRMAVWGADLFTSIGLREKFIFNLVMGIVVVVYACYFGTDSLGSGITLIRDLLMGTDSHPSWSTVAGRLILPVLCYAAGGAAGLLAPALAAGAVLGRQFNEILTVEYPNLMVLLGMIGFLSAFTRAPFTAFVLVLEMTDRHSAIFFMMVTSLVASAVARGSGAMSLYENRRDRYLSLADQAAGPSPDPEASEGSSAAKEDKAPPG